MDSNPFLSPCLGLGLRTLGTSSSEHHMGRQVRRWPTPLAKGSSKASQTMLASTGRSTRIVSFSNVFPEAAKTWKSSLHLPHTPSRSQNLVYLPPLNFFS